MLQVPSESPLNRARTGRHINCCNLAMPRALNCQIRAVVVVVAGTVWLQTAAWAQNPWPNVDGIWSTDGYGELLEARQNILEVYEVTSTSCIPAGKAKMRSGSKPGEIVFEGGAIGTLSITAGDDPGR